MKKQLCGGGLFLFRLGSFEITDSNIYILCLDVYVLCRYTARLLIKPGFNAAPKGSGLNSKNDHGCQSASISGEKKLFAL